MPSSARRAAALPCAVAAFVCFSLLSTRMRFSGSSLCFLLPSCILSGPENQQTPQKVGAEPDNLGCILPLISVSTGVPHLKIRTAA